MRYLLILVCVLLVWGKVDGVLRPLLNGEFVFHIGLLDQGYWPDGAFTAPTDEALLYDIELAKRAVCF